MLAQFIQLRFGRRALSGTVECRTHTCDGIEPAASSHAGQSVSLNLGLVCVAALVLTAVINLLRR